MTGDWSQEIKREYVGGNVRFDFPLRPLGWARLIGLFLVGFGLLFVSMPGHTAWEFIQKLLRGNRDPGSIIFSFFPLLFVIAGCLPMGIGLGILFGRCRVEWQDGQLRSTELIGPLRWTRRLPRKALRKLEVSAATSRSGNSPPKTIEKFSGIAALYEDGSRAVIALGYPKDWMLAVAEELKTYVGSSAVLSEPLKVEVVDNLGEPEETDDLILQQPAGSSVQLEERSQGIRLVVPPAGLRKGSKGLFFFSVLWCGFMGVFTGISIFSQFKGSGKVPIAFWIFIPAFWLIGLGLLAGAVNMGRRRAELTADSGGLDIQTTGLFGLRQRHWSRSELAAIRADASGMEVNNRPVIEQQIHPTVGKKAGFLSGRDEAELCWMAAQLRRALQLPPTFRRTGFQPVSISPVLFDRTKDSSAFDRVPSRLILAHIAHQKRGTFSLA